MNYIIVDKRDNTFFCGLKGWSKLEENAIWYGDDCLSGRDEMSLVLQALREEQGDYFYLQPLPEHQFEADEPDGGWD